MREEAIAATRPSSGFAGALRLIFDACLFAFVLLDHRLLRLPAASSTEPGRAERHRRRHRRLDRRRRPHRRGDEAARQATRRSALLITGVNRTTSTEELKQLASQGDQLFTCCVDIDKEARNTIDNATETSQWVARNRYDSIIVVTSNYHMPRALAELARVMPAVTLIPYAVVDNNVHLDRWWTYPGTTKLLISEYLKYLPALGAARRHQAREQDPHRQARQVRSRMPEP